MLEQTSHPRLELNIIKFVHLLILFLLIETTYW